MNEGSGKYRSSQKINMARKTEKIQKEIQQNTPGNVKDEKGVQNKSEDKV